MWHLKITQKEQRGGADVFNMFKKVASIKKERYISHRRPAT